MKIKSNEIHWTCRFHPTNSWHEVGCPHRQWTKEEIQDALETQKLSNDIKDKLIIELSEKLRK